MRTSGSTSLPMHTLLLCGDAQFLGTTRLVLRELHVTPEIVGGCDEALRLVETQAFDVIVLDWREINNLGEFLVTLRRSKLNPDCVLVAIVRDLLDLKQAFAAGVHFLIHKPASTVQIQRCLRAAYCATVARRRKLHREPVEILASVATRTRPFAEAMIANLSEGGAGLRTAAQEYVVGVTLSAGEEVNLRFALPGTEEMLDVSALVMWTTEDACGVRFRYIPEKQKVALQQWLTDCVERSLAEMCERVQSVCA
jgi:CheY-like chemotaxis protein